MDLKIHRRLMKATKAEHVMGNLSRTTPDLCLVDVELSTDTHYVGKWLTGWGFESVHFPKSTTQELTSAERQQLSKAHADLET